MGAKLKSKELSHMRTTTPLSEEDLNLMRNVLKLKVEQHPQLCQWLSETKGHMIVEDCSNRQHGSGLFWGASKVGPNDWEGLNWLGKLWMELRDSQRDESILDMFK